MSSEKQFERRKIGETFQEKMRTAWSKMNGVLRIRITDGGRTGSRPSDDVIIMPDNTVLFAELKSTAGDHFILSMLRPNQLGSLLKVTDNMRRRYGVVFVEFRKYNLVLAFRFDHMAGLFSCTGKKRVDIETMLELDWVKKIPYDADGIPQLKGVDLREW